MYRTLIDAPTLGVPIAGHDSGSSKSLSVIMPAFNEEKLIAGSISAARSSLQRAGLAAGAFEIVVVDNASTDATARLAERFGARVLHEPVRQIAGARNAGARAARGDWYLFLDADSWLSAGLAGELLRALENPRVLGGGAVVCMHDIPITYRVILAGWNFCSRQFGWAAGSFLFCRAEVFETLGGFASEYFVAEEIDLSRRLKQAAHQCGQRVVVLARNGLLTSSRKCRLYTGVEVVKLVLRMCLHPRRFFRDPRMCHAWYDGRR